MKILIAEENDVMRDVIVWLLGKVKELDGVLETKDAANLTSMAESEKPGVVFIDAGMAIRHNNELSELKRVCRDAKVVILADNDIELIRAICADVAIQVYSVINKADVLERVGEFI